MTSTCGFLVWVSEGTWWKAPVALHGEGVEPHHHRQLLETASSTRTSRRSLPPRPPGPCGGRPSGSSRIRRRPWPDGGRASFTSSWRQLHVQQTCWLLARLRQHSRLPRHARPLVGQVALRVSRQPMPKNWVPRTPTMPVLQGIDKAKNAITVAKREEERGRPAAAIQGIDWGETRAAFHQRVRRAPRSLTRRVPPYKLEFGIQSTWDRVPSSRCLAQGAPIHRPIKLATCDPQPLLMAPC